jgi:hypothetical protein
MLFNDFRNKFICYGEGLSAPRPTPKLEDHPLSFVRGCLFNIQYSQLPSIAGGRSFIRNRRTRHAVVTGNPPNMVCTQICPVVSETVFVVRFGYLT